MRPLRRWLRASGESLGQHSKSAHTTPSAPFSSVFPSKSLQAGGIPARRDSNCPKLLIAQPPPIALRQGSFCELCDPSESFAAWPVYRKVLFTGFISLACVLLFCGMVLLPVLPQYRAAIDKVLGYIAEYKRYRKEQSTKRRADLKDEVLDVLLYCWKRGLRPGARHASRMVKRRWRDFRAIFMCANFLAEAELQAAFK